MTADELKGSLTESEEIGRDQEKERQEDDETGIFTT